TLSANSTYTVGSPNSATVTIEIGRASRRERAETATASDAKASKSGDTGAFTITRTGGTGSALTVNYSLNGSASNGSDYQQLGNSVTIAAGSISASVTVTPFDGACVAGVWSVVLTLSANSAYTVGSPNSATVTI